MRNIIKQILNEEIDSKSDRVKSIVNKYGIDRAIEMVVGGADTIRQAYQDNPLSYLDQFNDLKPKEISDKIFYLDKDGNYLFFYTPYKVYIDYDRIWKFFEVILELKYKETEEIIKNWLEETYNIRGLTPRYESL